MNTALINFNEAQKHLGVSRSTLLRWLKNKRVTGYKAGKKWKFYTDDLDKMLLKESPSAYSTTDGKELIKSLSALLPPKLKCKDIYSPDFWCEWQDATQWEMITIYIKSSGAQIEFTQNKLKNASKCLEISIANAEKINKIWKVWSNRNEIIPQRSGKYSCLTAANNYKISTLQLPANINCTGGTYKLSRKNENKINSTSHCDIYVYGPPERKTAFTAYSILLKLLSKETKINKSVLTSENDPTYFLPDALQIYGEKAETFPGINFCLLQIGTSEIMPVRGISTPLYRIAYAFGKQANKLKESKDVIIIKAEQFICSTI